MTLAGMRAFCDRFRNFSCVCLATLLSPVHAQDAPELADARLAEADRFIDAFYSFDPDRLGAMLVGAAESQDSVLYYQGWAQGGNYRVLERTPCRQESGAQIRCDVRVQDDPVLALQTGFNVTDSFTLTFAGDAIARVETSSNDQPIYHQAREWVMRNRPEVMTGPCQNFSQASGTPADCARAMTAGFRAFAASAAFPGGSALRGVALTLLARHQVAGAAVVRIEAGAIAEEHYLGVRSVATGEALTRDDLFQVASVSKPVAAWAVMRLVSEARLALDHPVGERLTRWQIPASSFDAEGVTVRRLLSHTAGLSLGGYPGFREDEALPELVASLNGATGGAGAVHLMQPPGQGFSYSGGGYTLLQLLVEEVTGESFADYAARALFRPLGMSETSFEPTAALRDRLATPHGQRLNEIPHHRFRAQAAANLHTSASDLARFALANMARNPVLDRTIVESMHVGVAAARPGMDIGLGFFVSGADGELIGHGGSNFGWKAQLSFVPASGDGLVVLTNSESGGRLTADLLCFWDREYGGAFVQAGCAERGEAEARTTRRLSTATTGAAIGAGFCLLLFLLALLRGGGFVLFRQSWRWVVALSVAVAGTLGWLFFFTPVGIWLIAGFAGPFTVIDYLAPGYRALALAVLLLSGSLLLVLAFGRRANEQGATG
ncbi:MAG: serine hydrolase domain-containing protein [Pseudomonadota bacterium]